MFVTTTVTIIIGSNQNASTPATEGPPMAVPHLATSSFRRDGGLTESAPRSEWAPS